MTGESVLQLLLQGSILLFELTHYERNVEEEVALSARTLPLASMGTSIVAIFFGLSSIWLQKFEEEPPLGKKMRLITCNLADVGMRIMLIFSFILLSFRWRYGMITVLGTVCLTSIIVPNLISYLHSVVFQERMLMMDRSLLLTPMFWYSFKSGELVNMLSSEDKRILQKSRMKNKVSGILLSAAGIILLSLVAHEKITLPLQDAW